MAPVSTVKNSSGVIKTPKLDPLEKRLERLGLVRDWDFVLHLPSHYEDFTRITPIEACPFERSVYTEGTVTSSGLRQGHSGERFQATLQSASGELLTVLFLHFFPSIANYFKVGQALRLYGVIKSAPNFPGARLMIHPKYQMVTDFSQPLADRLTPIYPAGENVSQVTLRKRIKVAMENVNLHDHVNEALTRQLGWPSLQDALTTLHWPPRGTSIESLESHQHPAWKRLIFDELLAQQITLRDVRTLLGKEKAPTIPTGASELETRFINEVLPFQLTNAQKRVVDEVKLDLAQGTPMHRLIQGDVGCGKTVVAALCALHTLAQGYQVCLMAPTEILAEQHYQKLSGWLKPLGVEVLYLSGSMKASEKNALIERLAQGEPLLAIGTHALIQKSVSLPHLGLAIVDEQHRFGVAQRLSLRKMKTAEGFVPHLLMMTATPIPRTLAMSYLADIDLSVIDELPPGRSPIETRLVSLERREEVLRSLESIFQKGQQVYWVCPLIEESEKMDLQAATQCYEWIKTTMPHVSVGLVHGQLKNEERDAIMQAFIQGKIQLLVSTTVIEVGVDVPNATCMVIEHAERFGLAQLHQLRGRVGRGSAASLCLLLFDPALSDNGKERLKAIRYNTDGFEIARVDLSIRGPGEFLGERQSGMPLLRFASLDEHNDLLNLARAEAQRWLRDDPESARLFAQHWFEPKSDFIGA